MVILSHLASPFNTRYFNKYFYMSVNIVISMNEEEKKKLIEESKEETRLNCYSNVSAVWLVVLIIKLVLFW